MKKTVTVLIILLLLFMLFPTAVIAAGLFTPARYDVTYVGGLKTKMDRISSVGRPKIVVIGTSSVAFGLRSDILEAETGMPAVNFGLYASLGTKLMLDLAKDYIKDGDIVVIAPEQDKQTLSNYFNADMTWKAFDGHFDYLRYLGKSELSDMAGAYLGFASEKFRVLSSGRSVSVSGVYSADSFNEYGDVEYEREKNTMFGGYDMNSPISFETDVISDEFIDTLNGFAAAASKKGARVFFGFCPMNRKALEDGTDSEKIYGYYKYLTEKLDMQILSDPEKYIMDSGWFYDSNFHCNDAGAVCHTLHLAEDIKLALGDASPCKTEMPKMPETEQQGENETAEDELFVLSVSDKGASITGLTEKGAAQTVIEVPSEINGKTVAAIAQGAFSDAKDLTDLTLNDGLTYIADGAFYDCGSLETIHMKCTDPSEVRVGEGLLDGAEKCKIKVPEDLFDAYANDYFWAQIYDLGAIEAE